MSVPTKVQEVHVRRCAGCEEEDPEEVKARECSRCGGRFTDSALEGPPFRCPECNIFLGVSDDTVCESCEEPWDPEDVTLYRCGRCCGLFESRDEDHPCTPQEKADAEAQAKAAKAASDAKRADRYALLDRELDNTADALTLLGFRVHRCYADRPWTGPDGHQDGDVSLHAQSGSVTVPPDTFRRLVLLAAAKQEV